MLTYDEETEIAVPASPPSLAPLGPEDRVGLRPLDWAALVVLVAGGLNSGLIAAVNLDVFALMLPGFAGGRMVYGLVGLAALHCVVLLFRLAGDET
ncbi:MULTISPECIES: DUF378 domain-containing protein [Achromobacter]|jgi:uncharacterized protein|uniref:DUF378 domain-containing protein n=3 Tax=Achromobacter TaxID=222 RepID=A0A848NQL6_9BURK|nr:DUF378 domain-containing protein [Achromobacter ruhlandii]AKP90423.1 hypothetical protein Axylo_2934 [Achromobacter xylosoxidans]ALX84265.1 DUF378 domain-containing protein [Achromobacter denitrificans]AOU93657.1 uncharacterized protein AruCF_2766 [Achromobacter ruhlandii]MCI1836506.1 DUF378 domain-containing protein [Achromobacter ruhlandii]MCZ8396571.1 DUF378 domain-containing protein [Achromobacter ruhlandii]